MSIDEKMSDLMFAKFVKLTHEYTGITIKASRKVMLSGRIKNRMLKLSLSTYQEYLDFLQNHRPEVEHFINVMTTNETYFYRTPLIWDFFTDFLERWDNKKTLNVWSAASSTGAEAYTIGIFCEHHKSLNSQFRYQIKGSDISTDVIQVASKGLYSGRALERFKKEQPRFFNQYMSGDEKSGYQVISSIKSRISFTTHNLFDKIKAKEEFDIVFLRNVLIYFTNDDKEKVLQNINNSLCRNGHLIIGESESLSRLNTKFHLVSPLIYTLKENEIEKKVI